MVKLTGPEGRKIPVATVPLDTLGIDNLQVKLRKFEKKYRELIRKCKTYAQQIRRSRENMSNSKLQWELADTVYTFIDALERSGYFFANAIPALSRDTGISKSQLNYLIKFRRCYPNIDAIHQEINWSKYREILDMSDPDARKECKNKILSGEIKTDTDIRKFKKMYKSRGRSK